MTDRPIIFSAPMVRALLAGTKTQTRRIAKPQPVHDGDGLWRWAAGAWSDRLPGPVLAPGHSMARAARFAKGDRLYVRENFSGPHGLKGAKPKDWPDGTPIWFWADGSPEEGDWTRPMPSIHLPQKFSRLTLTVTDVRVERLQAISEADARAEGIEQFGRFFGLRCASGDDAELTASAAFKRLWNSINGPGAWEANPWVVAVTFTVEKTNIDAVTP